jgi:hypothetical protein
VYGYWAFLLDPLRIREKKAAVAVGELEQKLKEAREKVARGQRAQQEGPQVQQVLDQVAAMVPEGAPVAWFPSQISGVLRENGVAKSSVRFVSASTEKSLEGFASTAWTAEIPRVEFLPLARSLAGLENAQPLVEVVSVIVEGNREDPERLRAVLGLKRVVKRQHFHSCSEFGFLVGLERMERPSRGGDSRRMSSRNVRCASCLTASVLPSFPKGGRGPRSLRDTRFHRLCLRLWRRILY